MNNMSKVVVLVTDESDEQCKQLVTRLYDLGYVTQVLFVGHGAAEGMKMFAEYGQTVIVPVVENMSLEQDGEDALYLAHRAGLNIIPLGDGEDARELWLRAIPVDVPELKGYEVRYSDDGWEESVDWSKPPQRQAIDDLQNNPVAFRLSQEPGVSVYFAVPSSGQDKITVSEDDELTPIIEQESKAVPIPPKKDFPGNPDPDRDGKPLSRVSVHDERDGGNFFTWLIIIALVVIVTLFTILFALARPEKVKYDNSHLQFDSSEIENPQTDEGLKTADDSSGNKEVPSTTNPEVKSGEKEDKPDNDPPSKDNEEVEEAEEKEDRQPTAILSVPAPCEGLGEDFYENLKHQRGVESENEGKTSKSNTKKNVPVKNTVTGKPDSKPNKGGKAKTKAKTVWPKMPPWADIQQGWSEDEEYFYRVLQTKFTDVNKDNIRNFENEELTGRLESAYTQKGDRLDRIDESIKKKIIKFAQAQIEKYMEKLGK